MEYLGTSLVDAEELLDDLTSTNEFSKVSESLVKKSSRFLGQVETFSKTIMGYMVRQTGSIEDYVETIADRMKQLVRFNKRLDRFPEQFDKVKALIDWSSLEVQLDQEEKKVRSQGNKLNQLLEASNLKDQETMATRFKNSYSDEYRGAGTRLFDAVVRNDQLVSKNLLTAAMKFMENDRKKIQIFMTGLFQIILKAAEIEVFYIGLVLKHRENFKGVSNMNLDWKENMKKLVETIKTVDKKLEGMYKEQSEKDLEKLAADWEEKSNSDFASSLYNHLAKKFYWRKWLVLAYDDVKEEYKNEKHAYCSVYGPYEDKESLHGRNIHIASSAKDSTFDKSKALRLIEGLPTEKMDAKTWKENIAKKTIEMCGKGRIENPYAFIGVVSSNCNIGIEAAEDRFVVAEREARNKNSTNRLKVCGGRERIEKFTIILFGY